MLLIILLYALFATSFPISKMLLQYVSPLLLTGIRMLTAGVILLAYQYFNPKAHFYFRKKDIWLYLQVIFFGGYLTYILRFWGLNHLSASKTCFLFNLAPFLSSYYSYLFFNEKLTKKQWYGLGIGFFGLIPLLLTTSPEEAAAGGWWYISLPDLSIIGAVAAHSYSWILVRKLLMHRKYSPMMVNGIAMTCGGLLALVSSWLFEAPQTISHISHFAAWLAVVILISNIICHNLYGYLLTQHSATFLSFAGFIGPLFTAFYSWLLLGEVITWHFYVSAILVFIGLVLFYKDEIKKRDPLIPDTQFDQDAV